MKIGDVVYLTEPFKWWAEKDNWNEEREYPAGTPCRIIGGFLLQRVGSGNH